MANRMVNRIKTTMANRMVNGIKVTMKRTGSGRMTVNTTEFQQSYLQNSVLLCADKLDKVEFQMTP